MTTKTDIGKLKREIGDNVRILREASTSGVTELSQRAGIHRGYWYEVERGEVNVSLEALTSIAQALGVTVRDLLEPPKRKKAS
jgi:transcriptional regulator with XRE-family HTH domain